MTHTSSSTAPPCLPSSAMRQFTPVVPFQRHHVNGVHSSISVGNDPDLSDALRLGPQMSFAQQCEELSLMPNGCHIVGDDPPVCDHELGGDSGRLCLDGCPYPRAVSRSVSLPMELSDSDSDDDMIFLSETKGSSSSYWPRNSPECFEVSTPYAMKVRRAEALVRASQIRLNVAREQAAFAQVPSGEQLLSSSDDSDGYSNAPH